MITKILAPALGAFLALSLAGAAQAQSCLGGPFEGPYIGANLGFGRADATQSSPGDPSAKGDDNSLTVGGQVGYNRQCGHVVFGVEADFNYLGSEANSTAISGGTIVVNFKDEINWFGTVRGRVGVTVHNNALLYATGGWAYANTSHTFSVPSAPFRQNDDDFKSGWTIGGGIELVHVDRWLLRAEALYVDLRDNTHAYTLPGCGGCGGTATWDDSFWVGRLGLSYKFGVREPVVPLK